METLPTPSDQLVSVAPVTVTKGKPISGHPGCFWGRVDQRPALERFGVIQFMWDSAFELILVDRPYPHQGGDHPAGYDADGNPIDFLFIGESLPLDGEAAAEQKQESVLVSLNGYIDAHPYQYLVCLAPPGTTTLPRVWSALKPLWDADHPRDPANLDRFLAEDEDDEPEIIIGGSGTGPTGRPSWLLEILRPKAGDVFTQDADGRITLPLDGRIRNTSEDKPVQAWRYVWLIDKSPRARFVGPSGTIRPRLAEGRHSVRLHLAGTDQTTEVPIEVRPAPPRRSFWQRLLAFLRRLFGLR